MKTYLRKLMLLITVLSAGAVAGGCQNHKTEIMLDAQDHADDREQTDDTDVESEGSKESSETPETTKEAVEPEIFIDICGAVVNPGVYELDADSRVFQAIEAAGGLLPEAAASSVNQAQPVSDGQQIYVPTQEEVEEGTLPAAMQPTETESGTEPGGGLVNINTADIAALKSLTGIGDAKAQAILTYREEHGAFSSIEDIMQVPGIKESTFSAIKDKIAVK